MNYCSNVDAANSVVKDIERAGGIAVAVRGDVSCPADVTQMFDEAESRLGGRVTHLVNNAAVIGPRDEGGAYAHLCLSCVVCCVMLHCNQTLRGSVGCTISTLCVTLCVVALFFLTAVLSVCTQSMQHIL